MIWPFKKQERRKWARRAIRLDVMFGPSPPLTLTTSVDMSEHSLAFRASRAYELGTEFEVQVLFDPKHPESGWFYAKGKVARCAAGIVAVEFTKVSSEDARKLDLFFSRMEDIQPAT